jgi:hypothetical protein
MSKVIFDGPFANHQVVSNFPVGRSCRDQAQHLYFTARQACSVERIGDRVPLLCTLKTLQYLTLNMGGHVRSRYCDRESRAAARLTLQVETAPGQL